MTSIHVTSQIVALRLRLKQAQDAVKGAFGFAAEEDPAAQKLEEVKVGSPGCLLLLLFCFRALAHHNRWTRAHM